MKTFTKSLRPMYRPFVLFLIYIGLYSFSRCQTDNIDHSNLLFSSLSERQTGVSFQNDLTHTESFNAYIYKNFYNGGGVAIGDINNDGLADIYFCGNQKDNKLYLNKGDFKFKDITNEAGVASKNVWSSGVSMADVNGDGWLDIYVCKSGTPTGENRNNELFINNGIDENGKVTFTEQAEKYGINDLGLSTHAAFFDYDKDGDLDCYLLNNSIRTVGNYDLVKGLRERPDSLGGNKLYRNENGKRFTDVSAEAGIYTSEIGFGLGVTIGDANRDGWQDMFVSNDFFERDYLYINQRNGTFKETLPKHIRELSKGSMGADMADLNNDGFPEIYVTDMLPRDERRLKTTMTFDDWEKYKRTVNAGYHHQFTRNVLQLNTGVITDSDTIPNVYFDEIGRMADVHATDWSWGALMADFDNNGLKEIFVANGIYKDLMNQDYVNFLANPLAIKSGIDKGEEVLKNLFDAIPSEALPNYLFVNESNLKESEKIPYFKDKAKEWGLGKATFSNGSAYGDLDNDGDLDLVINNVNMSAGIYRNNSETKTIDNHFLQIKLEGEKLNPFAIGTQVSIKHDGKTFYQELAPHRGFQSSVDYKLNFGLGNYEVVDTLIIRWMSDRFTILTNVKTNQFLTLKESEANATSYEWHQNSSTLFKKESNSIFKHEESEYSDFNKERLIYQMLSSEGPAIAKADVNGDGLEDFYIGGAKNQSGQLFLQDRAGNFKNKKVIAFKTNQDAEDVDAIFFDADGDGDQDLYVASGTNELSSASQGLKDRLYFNDGNGNFKVSEQILPNGKFESSSCVKAQDFDNDGDMDLFVGLRLRTSLYGVPTNGYLLENDGKGFFRNVTAKIAPELREIGMITDAVWVDIDRDDDKDLIIVGEWMPITIFENNDGQFKNATSTYGLDQTTGWWNCIVSMDVDKDGNIDFVVGNHGLNTRFKTQKDFPLTMFINDFDQNGSAEQILCAFNGDTTYPFALRHDIVMQLPHLKKKYLKYASYQGQTVNQIFTPQELKNSVILEAQQMQTAILKNLGNKKFALKPLPKAAQTAPIYSIVVEDIDSDGKEDILMAGNFYRAKPEVGRYDGSHGVFLKGDGKGNFENVLVSKSGFYVRGEVRGMRVIGNKVIIAKNNDKLEIMSWE